MQAKGVFGLVSRKSALVANNVLLVAQGHDNPLLYRDHLTAQRATFANPKLLNEMVRENGEVVQGSLARIEPDGKVTRMWEAIETYMARNQPLIIIAGRG